MRTNFVFALIFWAVEQAFRYSPVAGGRFCKAVRGLPVVSLRRPAKTNTAVCRGLPLQSLPHAT